MVYIRVDETNRVIYCHNRPFDSVNGMGETKEELEKSGYFVDEMPQPQTAMGFRAVPYYNPETHKITYKYVPVDLPYDEKIRLLESAMNDLLLNGIQSQSSDGGGSDGK